MGGYLRLKLFVRVVRDYAKTYISIFVIEYSRDLNKFETDYASSYVAQVDSLLTYSKICPLLYYSQKYIRYCIIRNNMSATVLFATICPLLYYSQKNLQKIVFVVVNFKLSKDL